ncbi:hypothetical protein [Actinosynnema sp. NPDC020468]|uniref:hypothetical protein n=1 Tax=Actinosynnema sp. NPDC020468 TaxID=3154488 RepID=UPI0033E0892A
MADSGDIKITISFLREFQEKVLTTMVKELQTNPSIVELSRLKGGTTDKNRHLLAGSELWPPAKLLMDRYESVTGTAPTLYAQIEDMTKFLVTLDGNITQAVKIALAGEDENIKLSTELSAPQLQQIFGTGGTSGGGTGGNTGGNTGGGT